jgi:phosphohistidine phosphatase
MDVLIIRHAQAGARDPDKWPDDDDRPLTKEGARDFRKVACRLGEIVDRVDAVWSSALVRAWQTATILVEEADWPKQQRLPDLEPGGRMPAILEPLRRSPPDTCVVLVGHDPDLSQLIAWLLCDGDRPDVEMKKGGAALVRFDGKPAAAKGSLAWLVPPKVLLAGDRRE